MNDKHSTFDAEKLNKRKNNFSGYQYCPYCQTKLKTGIFDHIERLYCPEENCDFIFYQNPVPAAGAIVIKEGKILLVKRAHPPRIGDWCIPAGFMEYNEHPTETAVRELKEETGLDVELLSFFEVYSGNDDPRNNAVLILYLAKEVGGKLEAQDDALEVDYFGFNELPENIAFIAHIQALADYQKRYLK
ncbi:MAG: NUDIX hydrolase [Calditrichaeota bacterium]|nr:MAG: NUDIX hydrolase [Calditrichota bacterium]